MAILILLHAILSKNKAFQQKNNVEGVLLEANIYKRVSLAIHLIPITHSIYQSSIQSII